MKKSLWMAATLLLTLPCAALAQGDNFPSKPVTLVVASGPGGPTDIEARMYAERLTAVMGQPFIMEYKPGASMVIGASYVVKSKPDGYTLLVTSGSFTTFPALNSVPFDTLKDFIPISLMSEAPLALVTAPSFPAKNMAEYVAYAKANPGKMSFATFGPGSITHLGGEWIQGAFGTKVNYVAYKSSPPQLIDSSEGRLDMLLTGIQPAMPFIKSGRMKVLATTASFRPNVLHDVPTMVEQGIPGYNITLWLGIVAPAGTPAPVAGRLSEEFARAAKDPGVLAKVEGMGAGTRVIGSSAAEFRQFLATETARWKKLVADNNIKAE